MAKPSEVKKTKNKTISQKELANIVDKSEQLDLPFAHLLANNGDKINTSNLITLLETAPIFHCKPTGKDLYNIKNYPPQTISMGYYDENVSVTVMPSVYEEDNESHIGYIDFNEEILLSILIKLSLSEPVAEHSDENGANFTVVTTYGTIRNELAKIKKTRSLQEIKKSLSKMQTGTVKIKPKGYETSLIAWFQILKAPRQNDTKLIIKLNDIISDAIRDKIPYREYNHQLTYTGQNQIAVWIKKNILVYAKNISFEYPYRITLDDIYQGSFLFNLEAPQKANKQKLKRALANLTEIQPCKEMLIKIVKKHIDNIEKLRTSIDAINEINFADDINKMLLKTKLGFISPKASAEIIDYDHELAKKNTGKIFSLVEFKNVSGVETLIAFPTKLLIAEMKKANKAEQTKNVQ